MVEFDKIRINEWCHDSFFGMAGKQLCVTGFWLINADAKLLMMVVISHKVAIFRMYVQIRSAAIFQTMLTEHRNNDLGVSINAGTVDRVDFLSENEHNCWTM